MTTKAKAVKKPCRRKSDQPHASDRITEAWHRRPAITLATVATSVAILSAIGPVALAGLHYFTTHQEFVSHQRHDESKDAWTSVQLIRLEAVATRNRVNDCDIQKEAGKAITRLEREACTTYREEYESATKRLEAARQEAIATTKEER